MAGYGRHGEARGGSVRMGAARSGLARPAGLGLVLQGMDWSGITRQAWRVKEQRGQSRLGEFWSGTSGQASNARWHAAKWSKAATCMGTGMYPIRLVAGRAMGVRANVTRR